MGVGKQNMKIRDLAKTILSKKAFKKSI